MRAFCPHSRQSRKIFPLILLKIPLFAFAFIVLFSFIGTATNTNVAMAQTTVRTITATFNPNGAASIGATSRSCTISGTSTSCTVTAPSITRANYRIRGWATNASGTGTIVRANSKITLTTNATFYAITEAIPIRINLAGKSIEVITSSEISTKTNQTGDEFEAILNKDIMDGNRVIAQRGSIVKGVVADADPGGRVRDVATMLLQVTRLTLTDGQTITVKTEVCFVEAGSSIGKDVARAGVGAGIGAAIGAIVGGGRGAAIGAAIGGAAGTATVLATHGDPAVVAPETVIEFKLIGPSRVRWTPN
jgi:hypothetical protein